MASQIAPLVQLLTQTLSPNTEAAERQLRAAEICPGFGLVLLELLRDGSINQGVRQAGAIYFKNYILRLWTIEEPNNCITEQDRVAIKQHLFSLMLEAPKPD